jgi:hypothetical protein
MSYDAVLLQFNGSFLCDLGFSYNNNSELVYQEMFSLDKMKTLNFVFLKKQWNEKFNSSLLYVLSGFQQPDMIEKIYFKNTPGLLLNLDLSNFKFSSSGYYQFGCNSKGANVSAYFWNFSSELSLNHSSIAAGIDYISGNNYASTDSSYLEKDHMFDILYGARHRYYGNMDYFSNMQKGTAGGGLIDIYFDSNFDILNNLSIQGTYHYFRLQNSVPEVATGSTLNKSLANEFDLVLSYKPAKDIKLQMGYAFIISTESLNKVQNVSSDLPKDAHWLWLMCTISPSMVFNKKEK